MAAVAEELQQARDEVQRLRDAVSAARDELDRARTGLINGLVEFSGAERATAEARAAAAERRPEPTIQSNSTSPGEKKLATAKIALDARSSELAEAERQLQILEGGQGASSARILQELTNMSDALSKKIDKAEQNLLHDVVDKVKKDIATLSNRVQKDMMTLSNKVQSGINSQTKVMNKVQEVVKDIAALSNKIQRIANDQSEVSKRQVLMDAFLRGDTKFLPQLLKAGYSLRSLKAQNFSAAKLKAVG